MVLMDWSPSIVVLVHNPHGLVILTLSKFPVVTWLLLSDVTASPTYTVLPMVIVWVEPVWDQVLPLEEA